jgi:hypothetical protein
MSKVTEPGKWYLVVSCAGRGEPIPFAEAPSPDKKPDPIAYQTVANLSCPRCGHLEDYPPALISRQPGPEAANSLSWVDKGR